MDKMIFLAMSGAKEVMLRQGSNNHNLANLNTTGFKADLDNFVSLPVYGPGQPSRVYVQDTRAGVDFSTGMLQTTSRELDVAINGDGFIAIQDRDGAEGYTRAGDLRISSAGLLETGAGYPVMGNDGPIALPPFEKLEIGKDGTITILPTGQGAANLAIIDRIKLVKPDPAELEKSLTGVLRMQQDAEPPQADASVTLASGVLETSNVNAVEALVNMIELSRQFEMQVKMMKTAEDNDAAASKLLQLT